jgi:hypothetical protein
LRECRLGYLAKDDELLVGVFRPQSRYFAMRLFERHHRGNRTS